MDQAIAALLEKNGDELGAIQQYMICLNNMSMSKIGSELLDVIRYALDRELKKVDREKGKLSVE